MSFDVFAQSIGTISRHSTLQDAIKTAKKYNYPCTIFDSSSPNPYKVVKWIFPKRHG